ETNSGSRWTRVRSSEHVQESLSRGERGPGAARRIRSVSVQIKVHSLGSLLENEFWLGGTEEVSAHRFRKWIGEQICVSHRGLKILKPHLERVIQEYGAATCGAKQVADRLCHKFASAIHIPAGLCAKLHRSGMPGFGHSPQFRDIRAHPRHGCF